MKTDILKIISDLETEITEIIEKDFDYSNPNWDNITVDATFSKVLIILKEKGFNFIKQIKDKYRDSKKWIRFDETHLVSYQFENQNEQFKLKIVLEAEWEDLILETFSLTVVK